MNIIPTILLALFIIVCTMTVYFSTNKVHSVLNDYYTKANAKKYSSGKISKKPDNKYGESNGFFHFYTPTSNLKNNVNYSQNTENVYIDENAIENTWENTGNVNLDENAIENAWEDTGNVNLDENAIENAWENTVNVNLDENAIENTWENTENVNLDENAIENTWEDLEEGFSVSSFGRLPRQY